MFILRRVARSVAAMALVLAGVVVTPGPAAAATCFVHRGTGVFAYICEYGVTDVIWPDGHKQTFVIGTNSAVWDSYQIGNSSYWSDWRNLDGVARSGVTVTYISPSQIDIRVVGTYNGYWCKQWNVNTDWRPWYDC